MKKIVSPLFSDRKKNEEKKHGNVNLENIRPNKTHHNIPREEREREKKRKNEFEISENEKRENFVNI